MVSVNKRSTTSKKYMEWYYNIAYSLWIGKKPVNLPGGIVGGRSRKKLTFSIFVVGQVTKPYTFTLEFVYNK